MELNCATMSTPIAFSSMMRFSPAQGEIHRHKTSGKASSPSFLLPQASASSASAGPSSSQSFPEVVSGISFRDSISQGFRGMSVAHVKRNGSSNDPRASSRNGISAVFAPEAPDETDKDDKSVGSAERVNLPGLNGLQQSGLSGLITGEFTVTAKQPIEYVVKEVSGLLDPQNRTLLSDVIPNSFPYQLTEEKITEGQQRRVVVVDHTIEVLYGQQIRQYMEHNDVDYKIISLKPGEAHKNFDQVYEIANQIEEWGINRRKEPIIAIGGGVLLDIAGLAANLFRRNTPIIKVPTTLMAVVDASIGVKTAVNFEHHKNKLGTYCAPLATFYDLAFLETLDKRNLSNGSAEILKMACVKDEMLFELLEVYGEELIENNCQGGSCSMAVRRSIQGMLEELEPNLWEHILVRVVDYGHSISTEVEMVALEGDEPLLHGEAVNIDMAITTQMAFNRGLITTSERSRVFQVMADLGLSVWHPAATAEICWKGIDDMSRARDGFQRVPLMRGIGRATFVNDITEEEVARAVEYCQRLHEKKLVKSGSIKARPTVAVMV
ncbi:hypothetical protein CYMTET_10831 [Cymbomonas tetramitiformis]|uniref:3-dehydroquinate synthase domain-containing protein n=1 Tax=Cymbomonas tetramitiformis TaxID=36881 RepID=A0AAE0LDS0_9CHLO|nr:hypothetical protein CYMTET_10831 [Cymbomonas tetramitiformis]